MLTTRRADQMHHEQGGWFDARWHFSFGGYHDPEQMGVGPLRVFNDDRIIAGAEWPMHPHRDVESLTYVVEGTFEHDDSLGNKGTLQPGAVQVMSFSHAGAMHSERNGSSIEGLRFLQFWVLPAEVSRTSTVQQHQYTTEDRTDTWLQVMSPAGEDGLDLRRDARVWVSRLGARTTLTRVVAAGRLAYLFVISGRAHVAEEGVATGDAIVVEGPHDLEVTAEDEVESILIDVPVDWEPVGVWAGMH